MYTVTATGQVSVLGDRVPAKGEQVFSDKRSLMEAFRSSGTKLTLGPFLVSAFNSLPDNKPVKKFTNTEIGIERLLKQCRVNLPLPLEDAKPATKRKGSAPKAKGAVVGGQPSEPREGSKREVIIELLKKGATREKLQDATKWQAHSVRGFISTLGKTRKINVTKDGKTRIYKLAD